jgi:hypothetical protein
MVASSISNLLAICHLKKIVCGLIGFAIIFSASTRDIEILSTLQYCCKAGAALIRIFVGARVATQCGSGSLGSDGSNYLTFSKPEKNIRKQ